MHVCTVLNGRNILYKMFSIFFRETIKHQLQNRKTIIITTTNPSSSQQNNPSSFPFYPPTASAVHPLLQYCRFTEATEHPRSTPPSPLNSLLSASAVLSICLSAVLQIHRCSPQHTPRFSTSPTSPLCRLYCLSVYLQYTPSTVLQIHRCSPMTPYLQLCLSVYLSICLSVYLSICSSGSVPELFPLGQHWRRSRGLASARYLFLQYCASVFLQYLQIHRSNPKTLQDSPPPRFCLSVSLSICLSVYLQITVHHPSAVLQYPRSQYTTHTLSPPLVMNSSTLIQLLSSRQQLAYFTRQQTLSAHATASTATLAATEQTVY
jgi:hypothetical protein